MSSNTAVKSAADGNGQSEGAGRKRRILVAGGNAAQREPLVRCLQDAGYQITEVNTREEAAALTEEIPGLMALDVTLADTVEARIRERTAELKATNESLSELSARLLQSHDSVQRRIARELHDGVGQLVVAIKINNSAISRDRAALSPASLEALSQNDAMLNELHAGIRVLSHLLHPPLLDEAGLLIALQWFADDFSKSSGIRVTLDCPEMLDRASGDFETAVFRIVQECLANVQRHSTSRTATVRMNVSGGRARLEISDQGTGISAERQEQFHSYGGSGLGLRGIRERVVQLGGKLRIESSAEGTIVTAELPWEAVAVSTASV